MPVDPIVTKRFIEALSTQLEDHLASWKSSLADAKRDIENTLNAMSDRIPAQAKPLFPEDLMGMILEDVMPPPVEKVVERIVEVPVEKVVERIVEKFVDRPVPAAEAGLPAPPDWSVVRSSMASIEAARTQVDVLTRFLTQAQAHASRVALLVLRNDRLTGWKALGYDSTGGRDEAIKTIDLPGHEDPFAHESLSRERSIVAEPPDEAGPLRRALGGRAPHRTLLVPMVIRDRIAGLLCADELPGDEGRLNDAALESLTFVTGLCVDLLAARKRIPSPTLTPMGEPMATFGRPTPEVIDDAGSTVQAIPSIDFPPPPAPTTPSPAATPTATRTVEGVDSQSRRRVTDAGEALRALEESAAAKRKLEPEPRPAPRPGPTMEDLGLTTAIPVPSIAPPPAPAPRPAPAAPPLSGGDLTMAFEQMKSAGVSVPSPTPAREPSAPRPMPAPAPAPRPVAASAPAPAASGAPEALAGGGSGATPMAPPAGFVPRNRQKGDEQSRAVEDARRLARLLVSEIKLYNERKVEEGRMNLDLYSRLKDDIERSRQVFEERTPEGIRKGSNFFHEELVRILADGRSEALGPMG